MACKKHERVDGKKPGTLKCKNCSWRFPCPENTCGHADCIEFREKAPDCHCCGKPVEGHPTNFSMPNSAYEQIQKSDKNGSWATGSILGCARSFHHACRT